MLLGIQRKALLRIASGYRTISTSAIQVVTGTPPLSLLIEERYRLYHIENAQLPAWMKEIEVRWTIWRRQKRKEKDDLSEDNKRAKKELLKKLERQRKQESIARKAVAPTERGAGR
ncbi:hypothetical protein NQ314_016232 [Rhamnusium bicolor]|uniref:Uncharacterized protein n=1 Tax=Rhamnusium bicolor TaxID=1586634 RepID=A0AAV8WXD2_9CUCU|nr:hypothetical protein NQ314_016232 [Rhamnusium bicolor]